MSSLENQYLPSCSPLPERADAIDRLIEFLRDNRDSVLDLLTEHASYSAAESELASSIKALEGALHEVGLIRPAKCVDKMAVFMPSNVALYSYILYLVIPSLYTRQIDFRPASVISEQVEALHRMLKAVHRLPVTQQAVSQRVFIDESVRAAKVVLFTGTYANAEKIKTQLNSDDQIFIFMGQGVNPILVTETADIRKAVDDIVSVRLFNSGQDCMGPDVIFVQQGVAARFLDTLRSRLAGLTFGSRKDPNADYTPIYYSSTIEQISLHLSMNSKFIHYGGAIDYAQRKIEPTVLYGSLERKSEIIEFFGPVFNVVSYDSDEALKRELSKGFYRERAMGASLYGNDTLLEFLKSHHSVSLNGTLFDIEDGNKPFGGYGPMANYVYCNKKLQIKPILLSKIVSDYL